MVEKHWDSSEMAKIDSTNCVVEVGLVELDQAEIGIFKPIFASSFENLPMGTKVENDAVDWLAEVVLRTWEVVVMNHIEMN